MPTFLSKVAEAYTLISAKRHFHFGRKAHYGKCADRAIGRESQEPAEVPLWETMRGISEFDTPAVTNLCYFDLELAGGSKRDEERRW